MNEREMLSLVELKAMIGREIGVSDWFPISQDRINDFADISEDWQFIHVDPERASMTPLGGTVAHGFLVLSLLSAMAAEVLHMPQSVAMMINYGFDKLRFLSPVPAGAEIRARFTLLEADERKPGEITLKYAVQMELKGSERPALAAEWLARLYFEPAQNGS